VHTVPQPEEVIDKRHDNPVLIQRDTQTQLHQVKPKPEEFNLPSNPKKWKGLVDKIIALGLASKEANTSLENRCKLFNNAVKEYSNIGSIAYKKGKPKSRKNSLNDI
jgi:hypothetical protein